MVNKAKKLPQRFDKSLGFITVPPSIITARMALWVLYAFYALSIFISIGEFEYVAFDYENYVKYSCACACGCGEPALPKNKAMQENMSLILHFSLFVGLSLLRIGRWPRVILLCSGLFYPLLDIAISPFLIGLIA